MLKRKKPIGKCINLMAKAGIFIENRISMKGGSASTILIPKNSTVFPFCTIPKLALNSDKKVKLYKILPIN